MTLNKRNQQIVTLLESRRGMRGNTDTTFKVR